MTLDEDLTRDPAVHAGEEWPPTSVGRDRPRRGLAVTRVRTRDAVELFLAARPDAGAAAGLEEQVRSVHERLLAVLSGEGAGARLITGRIFISAMEPGRAAVACVRRELLDGRPDAGSVPALTLVEQPPCDPGQLVALQAHAAVPLRAPSPHDVADPTPARILDTAAGRHVFIQGLTGPTGCANLDGEARAMFDRAAGALARSGASLPDVVRTWFWLSRIERDYGDFNVVRNSYYRQAGVRRLPASTGIAGTPLSAQHRSAMDLHAFLPADGATVSPMCAAGMNEASTCGAAFSRGMRVSAGGMNWLHISGTASIDEAGRVVHAGDIEKQSERACANVEALLAGQGASVGDLAWVVIYLRSAGSRAQLDRVLRRRSWPLDVPLTVVEAAVCRPEWLVEIEGLAVRPA